MTAAVIQIQTVEGNSKTCARFPKSPEIELTKINKAEIPAAFFVSAQLNKSKIGVKKMPPPTPTNPETKPKTAPINKQIQTGGAVGSRSDFTLIANRIAAKIKVTPRIIL